MSAGKGPRIELRTKLGLDGVANRVLINIGQRHHLVLERPRTRILQFEDVCFGTARCLLVPSLPGPGVSDDQGLRGQRDGLAVIAATLAFSQLHPTRSLLVAGHTDSVGSAANNLALAENRALNVLLYLQGDRRPWAAHCDEHFARADFKRVHLWAKHMLGWDTDPGPLDETWNGRTKQARDEFRRKSEEELGVTLKHDVAQNQDDWAAIFGLYDRHLASMLRVEVGDLAQLREELILTSPGSIGCGESWPVDALGIDKHASADNRRVDVLFFDRDEIPDDVLGDPAGVAVYGGRTFKPEYIPVGALGDPAGIAHFELRLELRDHWLVEPVALAPYEIRGPLPERRHVRTGTTDDCGRLHEPELSVGEYLVLCDDGFTVAGARLTQILRSGLKPDVHRLHGHGADERPDRSVEYADCWVVLNAGPGDFVDHPLDEDFDEEPHDDEEEE